MLLPLVVIVATAGASIALEKYFRKEITSTGREQQLIVMLNAPFGSVVLRPGTPAGVIAAAESDDNEGEGNSLRLRYGIRNQTIGILQIGVGTDEGMVDPNRLAAVWRANGLSLASSNSRVQSDLGIPARLQSFEPAPEPIRQLQPLATPFAQRVHFEMVSTDAGTFIRPVMEKMSQTRIFITRDLPSSLNASFGFGEATLDISGLPLTSATIETGASKATVISNGPNAQPMSVCQVNAGIGECRVDGIANFNATKFVFNGGVGSYQLGFGGHLTRNMEAFISVGLGKCHISIPPDAARVQVFYDDGLLNSFNFNGLTQRREGYATSPGFDLSTRPILTLRLSSGLGKMSVNYH